MLVHALLSVVLKLLQILIDNTCLGLSPNFHLPFVHILLVLAANRVNSFIGGKALLAAVILGQAGRPEKNEVNRFYWTRVRSLAMFVTHSLTHSLTHPHLVNLIDVTLACEDAYSKLVEVVTMLLLLMLVRRVVLATVCCRFRS